MRTQKTVTDAHWPSVSHLFIHTRHERKSEECWVQADCRTENILGVAFVDNSKIVYHIHRGCPWHAWHVATHIRESLRRCDDDRITCMNPQGSTGQDSVRKRKKVPKISSASHNRATGHPISAAAKMASSVVALALCAHFSSICPVAATKSCLSSVTHRRGA